MADEPREVSQDVIAAQEAAELPDREAMSLIDANVAVPVNAAVAAQVLTNESTADATADQAGDVTQTNIA